MKHFVISGATGGIGRAIVREICRRGDTAALLVSRGSRRVPAEWGEDAHLSVVPCGMEEYAAYEPTAQADAFLHLAWSHTTGAGRDDAEAQLCNIKFTLDAVRLAQRFGCEVFLGAGSQAEYGIADAPLTPDTPTRPTSGYGIAKCAAGELSRLLCRQLGIRHVWTRILSVYGPEDADTTLIRYLIDTLHAKQKPSLTPCEQIWDYLFCEDAARALLLAAERGRDGAVYPVGSGDARPLSDYVTELRDTVAPEVPLGFGERPYYPHQPMYMTADLTALGQDTGFAPTVSFRRGIQTVYEALYGKER